MNRKIKVLMIGDSILAPSGVGHVCKNVVDALLKSGKFQVHFLAGAIRHDDYRPMRFQEYGDDLTLYPVDEYGNQDIIRGMIRAHKPDMLLFMTDPRFYYWLWAIENEVRPLLPMCYMHVWDNYPYPRYNEVLYKSTDYIYTISKLTSDIVKTVSPTTNELYVPHAVDANIFKPLPKEEVEKFKRENFGFLKEGELLFFYNGRNARRKMTGSLLFWFKDYLDKVGWDKASLLMHTEPTDPNGQNLYTIIQDLGLMKAGKVKFSQQKMPAEGLNMLYNAVDATINISDAEGFGLPILESLAAETPAIVNLTGGPQELVTDGTNWFGVGIKPASRAIIGSQQIPYIYEDRISGEDFVSALEKFTNLSKEERKEMGRLGREHALKNYNFDKFNQTWVDELTKVYEKEGSWETRRKDYQRYRVEKI